MRTAITNRVQGSSWLCGSSQVCHQSAAQTSEHCAVRAVSATEQWTNDSCCRRLQQQKHARSVLHSTFTHPFTSLVQYACYTGCAQQTELNTHASICLPKALARQALRPSNLSAFRCSSSSPWQVCVADARDSLVIHGATCCVTHVAFGCTVPNDMKYSEQWCTWWLMLKLLRDSSDCYVLRAFECAVARGIKHSEQCVHSGLCLNFSGTVQTAMF